MHFSVVIPLYNKQNSIVATLQSVLAQTYTDYEVVIVDDGSTDNSAHVVEEFIREVRGERLEVKDEVNGKAESPADTPSGVPDKVRDFVGCSYTIHSPSIHLIRKSNAGVSSARNEGIRQAKYKYVAFLDGDDYWEPTYLETQSQMLKDFPNAKMWGTAWGMMFGCDKQEGHGVGVPLDYCGMIDANTYFSKKMFLYWTDIVVVDKSIFSEIGMFDERMGCGEDVDLW